jgi:uncharacterized membrane protein
VARADRDLARGVFVRLFFTFRHRGVVKPSFWAIAIALLAAVFVALRPATGPTARTAPTSPRCARSSPSVARYASRQADVRGFAAAPKNVVLDTPERIVAQAQPIHVQTVVTKAMPIGNLTR